MGKVSTPDGAHLHTDGPRKGKSRLGREYHSRSNHGWLEA